MKICIKCKEEKLFPGAKECGIIYRDQYAKEIKKQKKRYYEDNKKIILNRNNKEKLTKIKIQWNIKQKLKKYFQEQFTEGMNSDNYGLWHIDHIKPCCKFDLNKKSDQLKCFNYTNLQPLWTEDNIKKGSK